MSEAKKNIRVLFAGGGTLGSVTPLLALYEYMREQETFGRLRAAWVGTRRGPEWKLLDGYNDILQIPIFTGKLRRYISVRNFISPIFLFLGFFQSLYLIMRFRPHVIINAGSYTGVPVVWAAWLTGIPSVLLQLDIRSSLSNIFTLLLAKKICASCEAAAIKFPKNKIVVTGIPVRKKVSEMAERIRIYGEQQRIRTQYGIYDSAPVALVSGGGTGAEFLNARAREIAFNVKGAFHIINITGEKRTGALTFFNGKTAFAIESEYNPDTSFYHQFPFVDDFSSIAACADVVVARAGMATISELAILERPMILIPIPKSHQIENAMYCEKYGAAVYIAQEHATAENLRREVEKLLENKEHRLDMARNARALFNVNAAAKISQIIMQEVL